MIPILFEHNATTFTGHGLGDLVDAVECVVKQTDTNEFELEMKYPVDGKMFSELKVNRIIYAKVNNGNRTQYGLVHTTTEKQAFRIYALEKEFAGYVNVKAQHISYDLANVYIAGITDWPTGYYGKPITTMSASSPSQIFTMFQSPYIVAGTNNFNIQANGYSSETWRDEYVTVFEPRSIRSVLFDSSNSLTANFGGVCGYDNFNLMFYRSPTNTVTAVIDYGDDLIDLTQEQSISEMITGILPYHIGKDWVYFDDDSYSGTDSITFGNIIYAEGTFERQNIVPVDLSQYFNVNRNDPTDPKWSNLDWIQYRGKYIYVPAMDYIAGQYAKQMELGIPDVNITVEYTSDIANIALYDLVRINFKKLGIDVNARVTTTTFDVLSERTTSIEVGKSKASRLYTSMFGNEYSGKERIG